MIVWGKRNGIIRETRKREILFCVPLFRVGQKREGKLIILEGQSVEISFEDININVHQHVLAKRRAVLMANGDTAHNINNAVTQNSTLVSGGNVTSPTSIALNFGAERAGTSATGVYPP